MRRLGSWRVGTGNRVGKKGGLNCTAGSLEALDTFNVVKVRDWTNLKEEQWRKLRLEARSLSGFQEEERRDNSSKMSCAAILRCMYLQEFRTLASSSSFLLLKQLGDLSEMPASVCSHRSLICKVSKSLTRSSEIGMERNCKK